jgi:hypothetical protein
MKGDYEDLNALKAAKNKANSKPIAGLRSKIRSTRLEIRNYLDGSQTTAHKAQLRGCDLKKQSQFTSGQIGVNFYLKGNYGDITACGARKNKPNSKPISSKSPLACHRSALMNGGGMTISFVAS